MPPPEAGDDAPEPDDDPGRDDPADESFDDPAGPRPDPLDRPWVHPTELRSFVAAPILPPREVRPREWAIGIGSAVAAIVATVLVLVAFGALGGRHRAAIPPPVVTNPTDVVDYTVAEQVAGSVAPSVVTVRTGGDPQQAVGSGVVIRSDRVITNAHLLTGLTGATKIEVVTDRGETLTAKLVGADPQTDLALLDVSDGDLTLASLGASSPLKVGQTVVSVTATRGTHYKLNINVVSDQNIMADTGTGVMVAGLVEFGIDTTPDMAGGALVDQNGNVVGILTHPTSSAATNDLSGGLAVPVSVVRDVEDQLDSSGKVSHGWLGVLCGADDTDRAAGGARLVVVIPDGPAAKAGLKPGDVVTRAGGDDVSGKADLVADARGLRPQDPLDVTYLRDGRAHDARVTLGAGDPQQLAIWPAMG